MTPAVDPPRHRAPAPAPRRESTSAPSGIRYFVCSTEPGGDYAETIVEIAEGDGRRYFATERGEPPIEVDERYVVLRRESEIRSLREFDEAEMAELEVELGFVRSVIGFGPVDAGETNPHATEEEPDVNIEPEAGWTFEQFEAAVADAATAKDGAGADAGAPAASDATAPAAAAPVSAAPKAVSNVSPIRPAPVVASAPAASATPPAPPAQLRPAPAAAAEPAAPASAAPAPTAAAAAPASAAPAASATPAAPAAPASAAPAAAAAPAPTPAPATRRDAAEARPAESRRAASDDALVSRHVLEAAAQVALAQGIAFVAHRGQVDPLGGDYIDHPGRVAERFDPVAEPVETAVAWLHGVIEDSDISARDLLDAGVVPDVVEAVQLLTRSDDTADADYYARIRRHPVARRVKLADIADNTAPWRVRRLDYETRVRLAEKYRVAREALGAS